LSSFNDPSAILNCELGREYLGYRVMATDQEYLSRNWKNEFLETIHRIMVAFTASNDGIVSYDIPVFLVSRI